MESSVSSSSPPSQSHEQEARLAVELLRTSRVVLLFGQASSDKTAFLRRALMTRLHRRSTDLIAPVGAQARDQAVLAPPAERRVTPSMPHRELVVYFDDWCDTPLAALRGRVYSAAGLTVAERASPPPRLVDLLAQLASRREAGFLIMLDRFEELPLESMPEAEATRFAEELAEAINREGLPANFLISIDENAKGKLSTLRMRIRGFDDFSLKLDGAPPVNPAPAAQGEAAVQPAAGIKAKSKDRPHPPPIKTEDVYAFIESRLTNTAEAPFGDSGLDHSWPASAPSQDPSLAETLAQITRGSQRRSGWRSPLAWLKRLWRRQSG